MKYTLENQNLTIYLIGEINSYNAEEVEKPLEEIISKGGFESIKIDMAGLSYISSAGLRIIVRIKQRYDDTTLINVPKDVNEILEMVGFQHMMKIEKLN